MGRKSQKKQVDLRTKIGDIEFKNPVTVASGTFGTLDEYSEFVDYNKLGAIVTKTITLAPREGNPMPRIWETPSGMLNAIGLENKGLEDFIKNKLPYFRKLRTRLIVSIAGETVDEFVTLAQRLEKTREVDALEINISCPNVEGGGIEFGKDPQMTFQLVNALRNSTDIEFFTKISPEASDVVEVARNAVRAGSDGLSLINTIKGLSVDIEKRRPRLANITGGLSGPAIKPIALRYLYEVKKELDVPVIAMGGITNLEDALEFIICGADLIAVGTANFVNPRATIDIIEGLEQYLIDNDYENIKELRGTLRTE